MSAHLVTGAGSGIGAAVAAALLERGDDVLVLARSAERGEALRTALPGATVLVADLNDLAAVEALTLPERLDSVVHSAGVVELNDVAQVRTEALVSQLMINLAAPALLTRMALPALRATTGTVVFVNSTAGLATAAGWGAYGASKAGLRALADALRAEEAPHGVRVTTVFPSRTATPMQESVHAQEGADYRADAFMSAASVAASIVGVLDLPRDITAPEVVLRTAPAPG